MMKPLPEPPGLSKLRGDPVLGGRTSAQSRSAEPLRGRVDVDHRGVDPLGDVGKVRGPIPPGRPAPARSPAAARAVGAVVTTGVLNCPASNRPTRKATEAVNPTVRRETAHESLTVIADP